MGTKQKIIKQYLLLLQTEEEQLKSVAAFCKASKIKEEDFFKHYNNLNQVEASFWTNQFEETIAQLEDEEAYTSGTSRERMLFFYFTFIQNLTAHRSYILFKHGKKTELIKTDILKPFKKQFSDYAKSILEQGLSNKDISLPPLVKDKIHHSAWFNLLFVIDFWCKDESNGFELTDAAIEKSINLTFDLMSTGLLERTIDMGKFLFQQYR
jgi:hypothetical protein